MPKSRRATGDPVMGPKTKTSITMPDELLQGLKHAAVEERTDVSSLLARLAAQYLASRKGGRR